MYEFKFPNVADIPNEKIVEAMNHYSKILEDKMKNSRSLAEQLMLSQNINSINSAFRVSINMRELSGQTFDFAVVDKLIEKAKELNLPIGFYVIGSSKIGDKSSVAMSFSQEDIDNLIELNNYLVDKNENGLFFMEDSSMPENSWTFEEVITANSQIDEIVEYIKEKQFSPFEAATFIHQYITTQFEYKENLLDIQSPRSIIGALNSDDIVCVGYASLTKAIIDKLNMPGLACSTFASRMTRTEESNEILSDINMDAQHTGHMQNLITVNDPKYDINGTYVSDACWDSKNSNYPYGKGIANFMYPVEDLLHLKGLSFEELSKDVDKVKEIYKRLGINKKFNPYDYPVICDNIEKSKPIDFEKYRASLTEVITKMTPKNKRKGLDKHIDEIMDLTTMTAYLIFDKQAKGSVAVEAHRIMQEELEKLDRAEGKLEEPADESNQKQ